MRSSEPGNNPRSRAPLRGPAGYNAGGSRGLPHDPFAPLRRPHPSPAGRGRRLSQDRPGRAAAARGGDPALRPGRARNPERPELDGASRREAPPPGAGVADRGRLRPDPGRPARHCRRRHRADRRVRRRHRPARPPAPGAEPGGGSCPGRLAGRPVAGGVAGPRATCSSGTCRPARRSRTLPVGPRADGDGRGRVQRLAFGPDGKVLFTGVDDVRHRQPRGDGLGGLVRQAALEHDRGRVQPGRRPPRSLGADRAHPGGAGPAGPARRGHRAGRPRPGDRTELGDHRGRGRAAGRLVDPGPAVHPGRVAAGVDPRGRDGPACGTRRRARN